MTSKPRAIASALTAGAVPWLRSTSVPLCASSSVCATPTPCSASEATTRGLWMSGPSVCAGPGTDDASRAILRARFTP